MLKIIIATAHHFPTKKYSNDIFFPIQVGASNSKYELNIQRDNVGDNISILNSYCSELTATYWIWKNKKEYNYYGLTHYRRFFTFKKPSIFSYIKNYTFYITSRILASFIIDSRYTTSNSPFKKVKENKLDDYLGNFTTELQNYLEANENIKCICLKKRKSSTRSNRKSFSLAIGMFQLQKVESIINNNYKNFIIYLNESLCSNSYTPYNMVIMEQKEFNEYCNFLFSILDEYHQWALGDIIKGGLNPLCIRNSGYIGELLTDIYIRKLEQENKAVKRLYCIDLESAGAGKSSLQKSSLQRFKDLINREY